MPRCQRDTREIHFPFHWAIGFRDNSETAARAAWQAGAPNEANDRLASVPTHHRIVRMVASDSHKGTGRLLVKSEKLGSDSSDP
jgi:hypothetical protein